MNLDNILYYIYMDKKFGFTKREMEILALIVAGLDNVQIAERLHITRHTVKVHISSMYSKARINSRVLLAIEAYKSGISKNA